MDFIIAIAIPNFTSVTSISRVVSTKDSAPITVSEPPCTVMVRFAGYAVFCVSEIVRLR